MRAISLRAAFLYYLQGNSAQKIDGSQIFKRQLENEENIHYSETWKSFRQQDLHRWVYFFSDSISVDQIQKGGI